MCSSDSSYLSDTQTPNTLKSNPTPEEIDPREIWGRLQATTMHLQSVDLSKQSYTLGRALNCDIVFTSANFTLNSIKTISKNHFRVERCYRTNTTSIIDLSKTGTFINGRKIGCGKTVLLKEEDEIFLPMCNKMRKVYIYKTIENTEQSFLPPQLRNRYEVQHIIGKGSFGNVFLLLNRLTGEQYAIKKIDRVKFDKRETKKLQNEIKILKTLSHPCVVGMKEVVETENAVFLILDYMKGGDLLSRIRKGIPENTAKFIFYQILVAVQYLHSYNITHRDIKPGNILLKSSDDKPLVTISDFGLSTIQEDSYFMSTVCGTLSYIAPEVLNSNCTKYSRQVDVWSLGVLLFQMLSNQLPFTHQNPRELFNLILTAKYRMDIDYWINISDEAVDLIKKMLVLDFSKRITIGGIFDHPWIKEDKEVVNKASKLIHENLPKTGQSVKRPREEVDSEDINLTIHIEDINRTVKFEDAKGENRCEDVLVKRCRLE